MVLESDLRLPSSSMGVDEVLMSGPSEGAQHFGVHRLLLQNEKQEWTGFVPRAAATLRKRPERKCGGREMLARELDAGQSSRARLPAAVVAHSINI
jgi:hypothetical protein